MNDPNGDSNMLFHKEEFDTLTDFFTSDRAEFLAVYGRRRVGKTYLINAFFENKKVIFLKLRAKRRVFIIKLLMNIHYFT